MQVDTGRKWQVLDAFVFVLYIILCMANEPIKKAKAVASLDTSNVPRTMLGFDPNGGNKGCCVKASESIEVEVGEIIAVLAGEVVHEDDVGSLVLKEKTKMNL
jgi:hypothetical protein